MWQDIEDRLEQAEKDHPEPLRRALFDVFRASGLHPGEGATKKMVSFEFGQGERLLWEIDGAARNVFLHRRWLPRMESAGFACDLRIYKKGERDGGRHSALSREWSFGEEDCIVLRMDSADDLHRLLVAVLQSDAPLALKPVAVSRWIDRLRSCFPDLDRFDRPDPKFDERERDYKLEIGRDLRAALDQAKTDQEVVDAIHAALAKSNLLQWRAYWPMSPKGDADRDRLWPALSALAHAAIGDPKDHPDALETFVNSWAEAVPDGKPDPARQIAEFLFLHLNPDQGIYIRYTVRQDFWREAVGSKFPDHDTLAETYADELRFMQAVREAFQERGLAPRDMIDVQGALWVVHSYKDEDADGANMAKELTRDAVEAAMDAYDRYLENGEDSDVFERFTQPKDFWVRSTRDRPNRAYPSKPIHFWANGRTESSGGWGGPGYSAAALHNAGYIIVDQKDVPVEIPRDKPFLIRDADRIRACALNYYIAPARERGKARVSIRAGALNDELLLNDAWPNVCQALKGRKFQELARVWPPTQEGPDASTTTTFTFDLFDHREQPKMDADAQDHPQTATNLVLYGPPGTGKTYATSYEAVRLCLGQESANKLKGDRASLMEVYRTLVRDGRVAFVTFHQSFSYEDFVEGLRPVAGSAEDDAPEAGAESAGFSLKPHDGVFKRISELARLDTGDTDDAGRLDRSRPVFKVALGARGEQEERIQHGLDNGLIHVGWGGDIDWSDERFDEFSEIHSEWKSKKEPDASGHNGNVVVTYSFRAVMQVGDYVVISDGRDRIRAFGRVAGDYFYDPDADFHPHRRPVEWIWRDNHGAERAKFYPRAFRRHSVYKLDSDIIDWDALEEIVLGEDTARSAASARDYVLIIDEINRANISKVFGELITLLEPDKRLGETNEVRLRLPYSGKLFGVPSNLHIIGTMNTADRSIALLDTALRRRFRFRELMPDPKELRENVGGIDLRKLLTTLNERIEYLFDREHQIGHAYFTDCRSRADVDAVMRDNVIPLLAEYFYEDWSKIALVLEGRPAASEGNFDGRFLNGRRLVPAGFDADEGDTGARLRWNVNEHFDFSDFAAT